MTQVRKTSGLPVVVPALAMLALSMLSPQPARAIPAFARKFHVKCYNCHTIPPVLNKTGYMFKRLGYRLPPDWDGTTPAPKVADLDKDIPFSLTNSLALVTNASFTVDKNRADDGTSSSSSSFNLDEAALFLAGSLPGNGFSYFAQFELYQDGESNLEQANVSYTGGRLNSSYFLKAGQMHMQEGEGTRAAMFYSLFPDPALTLGFVDAENFSLDQAPVGIDAGYTWASPNLSRIFAVSAKATNGLNADGSEILNASTKNSKDYWFDADYWFGPDGGVTFMTYQGTKDQIQNAGTPDEFTFRPNIRRYGVFGNYLFFDKLDILGGYIRNDDDWRDTLDGANTNYIGNGVRGEIDYYFFPGFAAMARYDRLSQHIGSGPTYITDAWGVGAEKALTDLGNVVLRGTYNHERDVDPTSGFQITDKLFKVDIRVMW